VNSEFLEKRAAALQPSLCEIRFYAYGAGVSLDGECLFQCLQHGISNPLSVDFQVVINLSPLGVV
jgi:hypothetical protein